MKQGWMICCAGLLGALALTGCSGLKDMNAALGDAANADEISSFGLEITANKTTKAEVFKMIGAPGLVVKNEQGGDTWIYPRVAVRQSDVGFQARGNFTTLFPFGSHFEHGGGLAGVGVSSKLSSRRASYKSAGLMISFNENGCVAGYKFTATSF